jgi:hypothetical protein
MQRHIEQHPWLGEAWDQALHEHQMARTADWQKLGQSLEQAKQECHNE